jgi:hypothetical protein
MCHQKAITLCFVERATKPGISRLKTKKATGWTMNQNCPHAVGIIKDPNTTKPAKSIRTKAAILYPKTKRHQKHLAIPPLPFSLRSSDNPAARHS